MSVEANLTVAERIDRLMGHLGIAKAHFAARLPADWASSAMDFANQIASLTLVCPPAIPPTAVAALASRTLVFSGDTGPFAGPVRQIAESTVGTKLATIPEYTGALWDDVIADHTDYVGTALLRFLSEQGAEHVEAVLPQAESSGEVADITYLIRGSGPPLVLLPLALSPSQWEPIISRLGERYCTITLGGPGLGIVAGLEERATTAGFLNMFRNLIQEAGLEPGQSVLEVGPGTGTFARWLANQTGGENRITGVDVNGYLVGEATKLAERAGLADIIDFRGGNGESLPFEDSVFDFSFSVTVIEEGDAEKMIAEMVRVTRPGGKIGAIVRALDIPFVINLPLPPEVKKKAESFPNGLVAQKGCADASLYGRFRMAGIAEIKGAPQFVTYDKMSPMSLQHMVSLTFNRLSQDEQAEWRTAMSAVEAEAIFFVAAPHHCAIGTKARVR